MIEKLTGLGLVLAGMTGLYFGVEFSGWVVFVGLFVVVLS